MPVAVDEFDLDIQVDTSGHHKNQVMATTGGSAEWCCSDYCSDYCPPTSRQPTC